MQILTKKNFLLLFRELILSFDKNFSGNFRVFGVILITAIFITFLRILAPFQVNIDQAIQLEGAYRLVQGLGLTSTVFVQNFYNINLDPETLYLTWWPPGFSIFAATFLFFKVPLVIGMKVSYSLVTLMGWLGWGIISSNLLLRPIKLYSINFPVHLIIAALLPFFYTPSWGNTDILLWAGIPWLILLLLFSAKENASNQKNIFYIISAGLLLSILCAFRYGSFFLFLSAFLILLQLYFTKPISFLKKYTIFFASACALLVPIFIYNQIYDNNRGLPEGIGSETIPKHGFLNIVHLVASSFGGINHTLGISFWLKLETTFRSQNIVLYLVGLISFIVLFVFPVFEFCKFSSNHKRENVIFGVYFVILSFVGFLSIVSFFSFYAYIEDVRYYSAIQPFLLLIFYYLIVTPFTKTRKIIKKVSYLLIFVFLLYNLGYRVSFLFSDRYIYLVNTVLDYDPHPKIAFPSNRIFSRNEITLSFLKQLKKDNPHAIIYAEELNHYIYEGNPGFRNMPGIMQFNMLEGKRFWNNAYTEEAVRVFWVFSTDCSNLCLDNLDELPFPEDVFRKLVAEGGLQEVARFPSEGTTVLVSDLPAGYQFKEFEN